MTNDVLGVDGFWHFVLPHRIFSLTVRIVASIEVFFYTCRGAELIEELRQKQMNVQEEQETKILEKIKVKMEKIKANQKKIQGVLSREPCHHDRGIFLVLSMFEILNLFEYVRLDVLSNIRKLNE